jgi:hypothetical protein
MTGVVGLKPNGIEIAPARPSKLIYQLSTEDEYRLRYLLCQAIDFLTSRSPITPIFAFDCSEIDKENLDAYIVCPLES